MDSMMPIIERATDWNAMLMLIVSVVTVILLIIMQRIYPGYYKATLYRMFVENFSGRQITTSTEISSVVAISIIASLLSVSAMVYVIICYSDKTSISISEGNEFKVFLTIIGITAAYIFAKLIVNRVLGNIFRINSYAESYNTLILDTERILGLAFVPLIAFCPFVSDYAAKALIWIGLAIIILLVVFQYVTFFLHLLKNKFFNHHSFLYFCALEVMPILILIKFVL